MIFHFLQRFFLKKVVSTSVQYYWLIVLHFYNLQPLKTCLQKSIQFLKRLIVISLITFSHSDYKIVTKITYPQWRNINNIYLAVSWKCNINFCNITSKYVLQNYYSKYRNNYLYAGISQTLYYYYSTYSLCITYFYRVTCEYNDENIYYDNT